jgi:lipoprotein NlpD
MGIRRFAGYRLFSAARLKTLPKTTLLALLILILGGCANALRWNPDVHTVRSGDTLYSIALRYNLDHRQLAAWNQLGNGKYIREGQRLRLTPPPAGAGAAKSSRRAHPRRRLASRQLRRLY